MKRKPHSEEYRKGYRECACMLKGWVLLDLNKDLLLKYIQRAITRNAPKKEQEAPIQNANVENKRKDYYNGDYYNEDYLDVNVTLYRLGKNYIECSGYKPKPEEHEILSLWWQEFNVPQEVIEDLFKDKNMAFAKVDIIDHVAYIRETYAERPKDGLWA